MRSSLCAFLLTVLGVWPGSAIFAPVALSQVPTPIAPATPPTPADSTMAALTALVASGRHPDLRWPRFPDRQADLRRLYDGSRQPPLLWTTNGAPTPAALDIIDALRKVDARGLDPANYDALWLAKQAGILTDPTTASTTTSTTDDSTANGKVSITSLVRFDVALSIAITRLASDLRIGRVNPQRVKFDYTVGNKNIDAAGFALMIHDGTGPKGATADQLLDMIEPPFSHYKFLKAALATTRADTADPKQQRHIHQIELSLERWRWIPDDLGTRFIAVNVPAFELYGFDVSVSRDTPQVAMSVVVGKAFRHETPIFGGLMQFVIFRPYWNVPPGILKAETLPKLRRNPSVLASERLEIVSAGAPDAPSTTYSASSANLAKLASGALRVRQKPGPRNALGLAKFMFPNKYDVYLHDTPAQDGFAQSRRDFSHGCVRVAEPLRLAEFVLHAQPEWTPEAIDSAMQKGADSRRVNLATPIPVYVLYGTAFATFDGQVKFYSDLYSYDAALDKALAKGYPYQ